MSLDKNIETHPVYTGQNAVRQIDNFGSMWLFPSDYLCFLFEVGSNELSVIMGKGRLKV